MEVSNRLSENVQINTSQNMGIHIPAEWAPQGAIWTAWPSDEYEWQGDLHSPRKDITKLVQILAEYGNNIRLLVNGVEAEKTAKSALGNRAEIIPAHYGDIWLRDTGPIFATIDSRLVALRFKTNSWGGKFNLPDDETVGDDIAKLANTPIVRFSFVLEGGAIDHDGEGTLLTTKQTVLNSNRNEWTKIEAENALKEALGMQTVLWIDEGLKNDHTDGHVDNIARFLAPGRVVCQAPSTSDDPNYQNLHSVITTLSESRDAKGRKLDVIKIPSVGHYLNKTGGLSPASHMNFIIANNVVVVPIYEHLNSKKALDILQQELPERKIIGLPSSGLLGFENAGGGSFHCITQQQPIIKTG